MILWWIANEKSSKKILDIDLLSNEIELTIKTLYDLNLSPKPWNEKINLDKLDKEALEALNKDTYDNI